MTNARVKPQRGAPRPARPSPRPRAPVRTPARRLPTRPSVRSPIRPVGDLPKSLPFSPKPWVKIGFRLLSRLGLGVAGLVLTPTQLADGTIQIIGAPEPRPRTAPWTQPVKIEFNDPDRTKDDAVITGPKKYLRGGGYPDPAIKKSLNRGRTVYVPKHVLMEVLPPDMDAVLDAALDRPFKSPTVLDPTGDSAANIARKVERLRKKRVARAERRRQRRGAASAPKPAPRPQPKPAVKPKPSVLPSKPTTPRPAAKPQPRPQPQPAQRPGSGGTKPQANKPPVTKPPQKPAAPAPAPSPAPAGKPQPIIWEAPEALPDALVRKWPEIVIDARLDPEGAPAVRLRTRQVRDRNPRREKDHKIRGPKGALLLHKFVTTVWGGYSEIKDVWEALYGNLYAEMSGRRVYLELAGVSERDALAALVRGDAEVDLAGFLQDFAVNQVEDAIIGRLAGSLTKAIIERGLDPNIVTATQRLNWLRRTRIQGDI